MPEAAVKMVCSMWQASEGLLLCIIPPSLARRPTPTGRSPQGRCEENLLQPQLCTSLRTIGDSDFLLSWLETIISTFSTFRLWSILSILLLPCLHLSPSLLSLLFALRKIWNPKNKITVFLRHGIQSLTRASQSTTPTCHLDNYGKQGGTTSARHDYLYRRLQALEQKVEEIEGAKETNSCRCLRETRGDNAHVCVCVCVCVFWAVKSTLPALLISWCVH